MGPDMNKVTDGGPLRSSNENKIVNDYGVSYGDEVGVDDLRQRPDDHVGTY
jgi:hypothetical protein